MIRRNKILDEGRKTNSCWDLKGKTLMSWPGICKAASRAVRKRFVTFRFECLPELKCFRAYPSTHLAKQGFKVNLIAKNYYLKKFKWKTKFLYFDYKSFIFCKNKDWKHELSTYIPARFRRIRSQMKTYDDCAIFQLTFLLLKR